MNTHIPQEKRNIAFVASDARSLVLFRKNAMLRLKELGFTVHILAPQSVFATQLVNLGFEFHHLPMNPYGTEVSEEVKIIPLLYRLYKKYRIAMAFHYTAKINIYGSIAAGRAGIPSIAVQTGLGELPLLKPGIKRFFIHQLYAFALRWSREVWFLNRKDRNYFLQHQLAPIRKTKRIPGEGVDLDHYRPKAKKVETHDELRFLFLGRLLTSKGVEEFVEAAKAIKKRYDHVRFLIVGIFNLDHPRTIDAEALYRWQKEGYIEFLGERMDVRPVLASSDCIVHPSYYNEGMSRVLLEAAAMEVPIITTDQVGCKEIVRDRVSGFVVPKRDHAALVDAISEIIEMEPTDRMVLGKNGRRHVERNYGEERVISKYINIVQDFLEVHEKPEKAKSTLTKNIH